MSANPCEWGNGIVKIQDSILRAKIHPIKESP